MKQIKFETAPEFELPPRTQWEPLVRPLVAGDTLFLADKTPQTAIRSLQPWAIKHGRRVRVQTGRRAGTDGIYIWFEDLPQGTAKR